MEGFNLEQSDVSLIQKLTILNQTNNSMNDTTQVSHIELSRRDDDS